MIDRPTPEQIVPAGTIKTLAYYDYDIVHRADRRARDEAIIRATVFTPMTEMDNGTMVVDLDAIIAAAEGTPLQRASREVTEQQDTATEEPTTMRRMRRPSVTQGQAPQDHHQSDAATEQDQP